VVVMVVVVVVAVAVVAAVLVLVVIMMVVMPRNGPLDSVCTFVAYMGTLRPSETWRTSRPA